VRNGSSPTLCDAARTTFARALERLVLVGYRCMAHVLATSMSAFA
jgi:hypothetical protein